MSLRTILNGISAPPCRISIFPLYYIISKIPFHQKSFPLHHFRFPPYQYLIFHRYSLVPDLNLFFNPEIKKSDRSRIFPLLQNSLQGAVFSFSISLPYSGIFTVIPPNSAISRTSTPMPPSPTIPLSTTKSTSFSTISAVQTGKSGSRNAARISKAILQVTASRKA